VHFHRARSNRPSMTAGNAQIEGPRPIARIGGSQDVRSQDEASRFARRGIANRIGRKLLSFYSPVSWKVWNWLPASLRPFSEQVFGEHLHSLVRLHADRRQYVATFFFRNRPEMELVSQIAADRPIGAALHMAVLACSKGAEVYSMAWAIRSVRPDLELRIQAVDISSEIVEFAKRGSYSIGQAGVAGSNGDPSCGDAADITQRDQGASIFNRMTSEEVEAVFDIEKGEAKVRPWLREGITWSEGDAGDPELLDRIGPQDIVVANRFLCHMEPLAAENCLIHLSKLVRMGGHLFVTGIDLDVRTKVAREQGWKPVTQLLKEIHEGDHSILDGWPLEYWGLEPFNQDAPDWRLRYASVFQIGEGAEETAKAYSEAAGHARG
jgi:chemotaxis methyl-accepting protein methylase